LTHLLAVRVSACVLLAPLIACVSVSPAYRPVLDPLAAPVFEDVTVSGLVFRDERVKERTSSVGYATASSSGTATATSPYGTAHGHSSGSAYGTAVGASVKHETFDNYGLQDSLRRAIEDARLARRVVPEAPIRIEGVVLEAKAATGAGRILWNIFNSVTLLMLFGGPYLGSAEATVELRLYDNQELVAKYYGKGRGNWRAWYYGGLYTIPQGRHGAQVAAASVAVIEAVNNMAKGAASREH
jgi:hypothetical protein